MNRVREVCTAGRKPLAVQRGALFAMGGVSPVHSGPPERGGGHSFVRCRGFCSFWGLARFCPADCDGACEPGALGGEICRDFSFLHKNAL